MTDAGCTVDGCGKPWDDHTLRELREHHPTRDLNMPYEEVPDGPVFLPSMPGQLVSSLTLKAAILTLPGPVDDGEPNTAQSVVPALCFAFWDQHGREVVLECTLPLTERKMIEVGRLFDKTITGACAAARKANGRR